MKRVKRISQKKSVFRMLYKHANFVKVWNQTFLAEVDSVRIIVLNAITIKKYIQEHEKHDSVKV